MSHRRATTAALRALIDSVDVVLFDADGVLWRSSDPIPGSADVVNMLAKMVYLFMTSMNFMHFQGKRVVLTTNNSTQSRVAYEKKCAKLGFDAFTKASFVLFFAILR